LGDQIFDRFGRLPFLVKILAVERPLSIQVHPSAEQAREGFTRERARGLPPYAAEANYRDDWPKPELLLPLTEFDALCGFRPIGELVTLFERLGGDCFSDAVKVLKNRSESVALRELVSTWLAAKGESKRLLVASGLAACRAAGSGNDALASEARLVLDLAALNPDDAGAMVALLLHRLRLKPRQALLVPAGVMHAYLRGFAVEVMASSDNVLRGGLTPKHVDVAELLSVVRFASHPPLAVQPEPTNDVEEHFDLDGVPHFRVSRIAVGEHRHWCASNRGGPEMLLCVEGRLEVSSPSLQSLALGPGECAWIRAREDIYCATGQGIAYRVQSGI
jgi:mannose-6-phosphate isomerase